MRWSWLLLFATLSGCAVFCGPTVYYLSGVTAWSSMDSQWDRAKAEEGLRAMGGTVGGGTECSLAAQANGSSLEANGCGVRRVDVRVSFATEPPVQGKRNDVEATADALIETHRREVESMYDAFAAATGWSRIGGTTWDKGLLHGDC